MTQTLRRSKSKYARTRRQNKKQRRIRGGGFLGDLVNKFKPSTDEEKCKELKEAAQTACSKVAEGDIEMTGMASGTAEYGASSSTTPVGDRISSSTSSSIIPFGKGLSGSGEGFSGSDTVLSSGSDTTGLSSGSGDELSSGSDTAGSDKGGAKKSRRKNKKRSQSRRKKHKSRKHKK
jgi:hypothetical protein